MPTPGCGTWSSVTPPRSATPWRRFSTHVAFQVSVSARKIARFATEDWRPAGETRVDVRA
ncbi:MAG: hypothetical protein MZV70_67705 [Desulfobacterales bacterium]|nr:hypothetical protein [Desulfobacterales bacterium]